MLLLKLLLLFLLLKLLLSLLSLLLFKFICNAKGFEENGVGQEQVGGEVEIHEQAQE